LFHHSSLSRAEAFSKEFEMNYGYFRHRFDAHKDVNLHNFIGEVGVIGYAYYYTLLELYGARYFLKDDEDDPVTINVKELANVWECRKNSAYLILIKMQESGILTVSKLPLSTNLVTTKLPLSYSIDIPNFLKIFGSYKKKDDKEKKRKEKKSKIKENEIENKSEIKIMHADQKENEINNQSIKQLNTTKTKTTKKTKPSNNPQTIGIKQEIIEYLNLKTKKNYKHNSTATNKYLEDRLRELYTLEDFKKAIDVKCFHWLGDDKMRRFLRPETLFGNKFESYLNEWTESECYLSEDELDEKMSKELSELYDKCFKVVAHDNN